MTKWVLLGAGAVLAVWGLYWGWTGWSIVEVERGWSAVVSGAAVFSAGAIIAALGALCWQLEQFIKSAGLIQDPRAGGTYPQQSQPSVVVVTAPAQTPPAAAVTATAAAATAAAAMAAAAVFERVDPPPAPAPAPAAGAEPVSAAVIAAAQAGNLESTPPGPPPALKEEAVEPQLSKPASEARPARPPGGETEKPWLRNPGQAFAKPEPEAEADSKDTGPVQQKSDRAVEMPLATPRVIIPPPRGPVQFRVIEGAQAQEPQSNAPAANANDAVAALKPPPAQTAPAPVDAPHLQPEEKAGPQPGPLAEAQSPAIAPEAAPLHKPPPAPRRPMPPMAPLTMNAPWPAAPAGTAKPALAEAVESVKAAPAAPASPPPPAPEPSSALDKLMAEFDALPQQIETAAISPAVVKDIAVTAQQEPPAQTLPAQDAADQEAASLDATPAAPRTLVREYESQGIRYFLYADGSVDAHAPSGVYQFGSLEELRIYIESRGAR